MCERPLSLRLIAGPDPDKLSFILKENETGEVEVRPTDKDTRKHAQKYLLINPIHPINVSLSLLPLSGMLSQFLSCRTSWSSWRRRRLSVFGWWSRNTLCIDRNYSKRYGNTTPNSSPMTLKLQPRELLTHLSIHVSTPTTASHLLPHPSRPIPFQPSQ